MVASLPVPYASDTLSAEVVMRRQGLAIFVIFFGIATLDALTSGRWLRIVFWVAMGMAFAALDWWGSRRRDDVR